MALIDIGANLTHESFAHDLDTVLADAKANSVDCCIVTGASKAGSEAAIGLAQQYSQLYATCGMHPHEASAWNTDMPTYFSDLAKQQEVVAVGECGLDYFRDFSPRDMQKRCFTAQLEIASDIQKPVFLHQRDAHNDFYDILKEYRASLGNVVVHCFTGIENELDAYLALDCHIGITGWICDERRGHHLREFIHKIPADRLMIETDAPYLLPRDLKPKPKTRRNEPKWLAHIANTVAACVNKTPETIAAETSQTARAFFNLPD